MKKRTKAAVAAVVLAAAVSYLAYAAIQSGRTYYISVDAFLAEPSAQAGKVRLHGKAAAEGLFADASAMQARFTLQGETKSLPVSYRGPLPELFKSGCDVVVEGRLDSGGTFQADLLLTKCASKYMPQKNPKPAEPTS